MKSGQSCDEWQPEIFVCVCVAPESLLVRKWFYLIDLVVKEQPPHSLMTGNLCIIRKPTITFKPMAAVRCVTRGHRKWVLVVKTIAVCLWSSGRTWAGEGHVSKSFGSSLKRGNELESWAAFLSPPPASSFSSSSSKPSAPEWHPAKETWREDGLIKDKPQSHAEEISCFQLHSLIPDLGSSEVVRGKAIERKKRRKDG